MMCCAVQAAQVAEISPSVSTDAGSVRNNGGQRTASDYVLGPDDRLSVFVPDLEESFARPTRVDFSGDVDLPLVGRLHASGLTTQQLEAELNRELKKYLKEPAAVITVTEFHSQPISVLGQVMSPGIHQIQGRKSLFEVLSLAGGLRPDAGGTVKITRDLKWGAIPLPGAHEDATRRFSVASVSVKSIMDASDPAENITIRPDDVISVPKAELVYVVGSVTRPGGFTLGENETLSALQVVSLAEGLLKTAASDKAKILRRSLNSSTRTEIPVNLKRLLADKAPDVALKANDILFVPNSAAKTVGYRSLEAVVQAAGAVAVYGRY